MGRQRRHSVGRLAGSKAQATRQADRKPSAATILHWCTVLGAILRRFHCPPLGV